MAGDVENDIEAFINQQKQKLAQERQGLQQEDVGHERKTWDKPSNDHRPALAEEKVQRVQTPERGLLIGRNSVEARRRKLQEDRRREYNDLLAKKSPEKGSRRLPTPNGRSLPVGGGQDSVTEKRKALQEERTREYNKMLSKSPIKKAQGPAEDEGGLKVGQYTEQKKILEAERMREYNEFLDKKSQASRNNPPPARKHVHFDGEATVDADQQGPLRDGYYSGYGSDDSRAAQLKHQYNEASLHTDQQRLDLLRDLYYEGSLQPGEQRKRATGASRVDYERSPVRGNLLPVDQSYERFESVPVHYDDVRNFPLDKSPQFIADVAANQNRDEDTGQKKNSQSSRKENLPPRKPTPETFLNNLGKHEQQKKKLSEERKKEYQQLLAEKSRRAERTIPRGGEGLAAPGVQDGYSHQGRDDRKHKLNHRGVLRVMNMSDDENEEPDINTYSRLPEVDATWLEERPPVAPRKGWVTPTYEEMLQRKKQEENRYRRYNDPELAQPTQGVAGRDGNVYRPQPGIIKPPRDKGLLEDDNWLRPEEMKTELFNALSNMRDSVARAAEDSDSEDVAPSQTQNTLSPRRHVHVPDPVQRPLATLLIGHEETSSAKRRKKEAYRNELRQQMQERQEAIKREKIQDSQVNAAGLDAASNLPPQQAHNGPVPPIQTSFPSQLMADYQRPGNNINPYLNALDSLSARTEAVLDRRTDLQYPGGGSGILDRGWEGLIDRPRQPIRAPVPQPYENSSYLSGVPDYGAVNEAYHLSGMTNPLDSYNGFPSPRHDADPATKVKFDQQSVSPRKADDRPSVLPFPVEENVTKKTKQKQDTQSYQAELQKQIEEQKLKKKMAKEEEERLDKKWEEENRNYNPYGRGGGGAPIKDSTGQTLADLRHLRIQDQDGHAVKQSPRGVPQPVSPRLVANSPPLNTSEDASFARGGHGIFGVPKTHEEKTASDRYKDELRLQIEDKRRREAEEKEKLRLEDEKENQRLEDQQRRMQQEFEQEQRKKLDKEEEARRKNEELRLLTEEKKRQAEEEKKKLEDQRLQALREKEDEEARERQRARYNAGRSSPPVPAVKNKLSTEQRGESPVVPALRKHSVPSPKPQANKDTGREDKVPRANSADVLNQLAAMRRQLQNERARVENALDRQKNDYEVYDPRLVQRPPVVPRREPELDVFEEARNRAPVSVRRPPPDNANASNIKEFNYLKNKAGGESRQGIRQNYPETPETNQDLEAQQLALIRNQEERLKKYMYDQDKSDYERALPNMAPRDLGLGPQEPSTPQALLESDSAFIDFNGVSNFPDDFDDLPRRNELARQKRRDKPSYSPRYNEDNFSFNSNPMGSDTSLNVDRISKKNEERLKRLKQMTGDDVSLADPDDVLDRFMARQRHNRPPSGQTLLDDTWMRPGSK